MLDPRARTVVAGLTQARLTVASAESLTGGLVSAALTSVPGASACVVGGVVAYDTAVKRELLGVPDGVVAEHGVVSGPCAAAMAAGARALLHADFGVATTGVAGPDRQEGKPVGTVFVAVSGPGVQEVHGLSLEGDRAEIRSAAVAAALQLLASAVAGSVQVPPGQESPGQDSPVVR